MSPEDYETVVSEIVAGICLGAPELARMSLGFGRRNKLHGASFYKHQIDVSLAGVPDIYLIECKRWDAKVGVEEVMVLATRGMDITQSSQDVNVHCILVTRIGATRGAVMLAAYFGIELEVVRSAQDFGMRIGQRISVAMVDPLVVSDAAACTLTRNGVVIP